MATNLWKSIYRGPLSRSAQTHPWNGMINASLSLNPEKKKVMNGKWRNISHKQNIIHIYIVILMDFDTPNCVNLRCGMEPDSKLLAMF